MICTAAVAVWCHFLVFLLKGLCSEIEKEDDPVALLPKVVALLFAQVKENKLLWHVFNTEKPNFFFESSIVKVFNKALQAPGRTILAAINHLKVFMIAIWLILLLILHTNVRYLHTESNPRWSLQDFIELPN